MKFESKKGQNEKKCKKTHFVIWKKTYFFYSSFGWSLGFCLSKMIWRAWEPITFKITPNEQELRKICQSVGDW
jgi:hypothetical protein